MTTFKAIFWVLFVLLIISLFSDAPWTGKARVALITVMLAILGWVTLNP